MKMFCFKQQHTVTKSPNGEDKNCFLPLMFADCSLKFVFCSTEVMCLSFEHSELDQKHGVPSEL